MSKFEEGQRVNLPGVFGGIQGRISKVEETVPGCPIFSLTFVDDSGSPRVGLCSERDLLTTNVPPTKRSKAKRKPAPKRKRK